MLLYWVHVVSLCCNCTWPVGGTIVNTVGLLWKLMTVRCWKGLLLTKSESISSHLCYHGDLIRLSRIQWSLFHFLNSSDI